MRPPITRHSLTVHLFAVYIYHGEYRRPEEPLGFNGASLVQTTDNCGIQEVQYFIKPKKEIVAYHTIVLGRQESTQGMHVPMHPTPPMKWISSLNDTTCGVLLPRVNIDFWQFGSTRYKFLL